MADDDDDDHSSSTGGGGGEESHQEEGRGIAGGGRVRKPTFKAQALALEEGKAARGTTTAFPAVASSSSTTAAPFVPKKEEEDSEETGEGAAALAPAGKAAKAATTISQISAPKAKTGGKSKWGGLGGGAAAAAGDGELLFKRRGPGRPRKNEVRPELPTKVWHPLIANMGDGRVLTIRVKLKETKKDRLRQFKKEQKKLARKARKAGGGEAQKWLPQAAGGGAGVPDPKPKPLRRALAASPVGIDPASIYKPPPDLVDQVRIAKSQAQLLASRVLDDDDVPCDATFNWDQGHCPHIPTFQLRPGKFHPEAYLYMTQDIWKLASYMSSRLGPDVCQLILGNAVVEKGRKPAEEWSGPTKETDPALVIPPLGTIFTRLKDSEDCMPDLGDAGDLRALWEWSRNFPVGEVEGKRKRKKKVLTDEEGGVEALLPPEKSGADGGGAAGAADGAESTEQQEEGHAFTNDPSVVQQGRLPRFRLQVQVESDGSLKTKKVACRTPEEDEEAAAVAAAAAVIAAERDGELQQQEKEEEVVMIGEDIVMDQEMEAEDVELPSGPGDHSCRLLRFWETGHLAMARQDQRKEGLIEEAESKKKKHERADELGEKEDEMLSQLLEAQFQLATLMKRNLGKAKMIYDGMVQSFNQGKGRYAEQLKTRGHLADYKKLLKKQAASQAAEHKRDMEEVNTQCAVCHRSEAGGRNSIVFCDRCNMPVHTFCYCVATLPAGSWHCQHCEYLLSLGLAPNQQVEQRCTLCSGTGGAIRQSASGEWTHVECCRWLGLIDGRSGVIPSLEPRLKVLRRRFAETYHCNVTDCAEPHAGGLMPCSELGCENFFHIFCGRRAQQEMYLGSRFGPLAWKAFCIDHSNFDRLVKTITEVEASYEPSNEEVNDLNPVFTEIWAQMQQEEEERKLPRVGAGKSLPKEGSEKEALLIAFRQAIKEEEEREAAAAALRAKEEHKARTTKLARPPPPPPASAGGGGKKKVSRIYSERGGATAGDGFHLGGESGGDLSSLVFGSGAASMKSGKGKRGPYRKTRIRQLKAMLNRLCIPWPPGVDIEEFVAGLAKTQPNIFAELQLILNNSPEPDPFLSGAHDGAGDAMLLNGHHHAHPHPPLHHHHHHRHAPLPPPMPSSLPPPPPSMLMEDGTPLPPPIPPGGMVGYPPPAGAPPNWGPLPMGGVGPLPSMIPKGPPSRGGDMAWAGGEGSMEWDGSSLGGSVYSGIGPPPSYVPKKRARPGGPYYDDYDMMDMFGGGGGMRKKKVAPKGFECEGCGLMIGTLSNLDRHKTKSCVVLVKGLPRPEKKPNSSKDDDSATGGEGTDNGHDDDESDSSGVHRSARSESRGYPGQGEGIGGGGSSAGLPPPYAHSSMGGGGEPGSLAPVPSPSPPPPSAEPPAPAPAPALTYTDVMTI